MKWEFMPYADGDAVFEAFVAYDERIERKMPCVLIAHHWAGQTDETRDIAKSIAAHGYVAVALDLYGEGKRGETPEECNALMEPLANDRDLLASRLSLGIRFASAHHMVDPSRIGAIGHCFGGMCVLDMARRNLGPQAIVSLHGVLKAGPHNHNDPIQSKVLVLHGDRDPYATDDDVAALRSELTQRGAVWEIHTYGHAMHAFTWAGAAMPELGLAYNAYAAQRSWKSMMDFLHENLAAAC